MSNLLKRSITGIIFVIVIVALLNYNVYTATIFFFIITAFTSFEYANITRKTSKDALFNLTLFAGTVPSILPFFYPDVYDDIGETILVFTTAMFYLVVFINVILNIKINHHKIGPLIALLYIGIPMAVSCSMNTSSNYQSIFPLSIIISMWVSDTGAYVVGRMIGRTPLLPRLSPNKTIEGWLGGGALCTLAGYLMSLYFPQLVLWEWIIVMLMGWLLGSLGDLFESAIKRQFNIKDSGNILPGHGGFLDRFDSFLIAAPGITLFLYFLGKF